MNTEAVMCMALISTKPSLTPLSRRQSSTSRVMLRNARRPGTSNHNSLRKDFTLPLSLLCRRLEPFFILGAIAGRDGERGAREGLLLARRTALGQGRPRAATVWIRSFHVGQA